MESKLICENSKIEYSNVGFFIDISSILSFTTSDYSNPNDFEMQLIDEKLSIENNLKLFLESFNDNGIILFYIDETKLFHLAMEKEFPELREVLLISWRNKIKDLIQIWSEEIKKPIYYFIADYNPIHLNLKPYFLFPNAGAIAWLQYRHKINLKKSFFATLEEYFATFEELGLKNVISGLGFFQDNSLDFASKL